MMCIFILSPIVVFFLLNTSNYSCFVAACGLLFFHIGVVCLIFTSLLLYYVIILLYFFLYFYLCRQDGTNFRWTIPEKMDNPLYLLSTFFVFRSPPSLSSCPVPQNHRQLSDMTRWAFSCGTNSFFVFSSTYPFLGNLVLDTFGAHHCIPYVSPSLSLLR